MAENREEAVELRKAAKFSCTSNRKALEESIEEKKNPELLSDNVDLFVAAFNKLMKACDEVAAFDEESSDEEKASLEYKEKVMAENDAILYKYKVYLQKFKEDKDDAASKAKRAEKTVEERKIYEALIEEFKEESTSLLEKAEDENSSVGLINER